MLFAAEDFFRWQPHPEIWVLVVGLAGLYAYALRSIGPRAVPAGRPVASAANKRWFALGIVLLGEEPSALQLAGAACILAGLVSVATRRRGQASAS